MKRDFTDWLSTFRDSIATYSYYIDFEKVYGNVENIKIELNILNSLIGSKTIEKDFENILSKYPETLKCIPILLAVRNSEISVSDENGSFVFDFSTSKQTVSEYSDFMKKSGLFDLLQNHLVNNLVDYVTGVETGLDSNGRKNRGGHLMEDLVESYIKKAGFEKDKNYFKEMYIHEITEKWNDFVVKTENQIYVVETNFYGSGGSKLNETARSYKTLSSEIDTIDGVTFVWFTDGNGWQSARHNLEETFDVMENIYCIKDMENGVIEKVFN